MSTVVFDQDILITKNLRASIIKGLRSALNSAEAGEEEVTICQGGFEITWNIRDGEFYVIA